jgi:phage gp29-like protein
MALGRAPLVQIPYGSWSGVDNNVDVEGILRAFEYGNFRTASMFADQILRDDRINGILSTRSGGLLATPLTCKPADETPKAAEVASYLGGDDKQPGIWDELFPSETIAELMRWGHQLGFGVAEIIWRGEKDAKGRLWHTPRLRVWHPQFVYWNWATFSFWIITANGMEELPKIDENPRSDGKWVVWCPRGFIYGWIHGLIRPLSRLYLMRAWNYRDWARYNEVYGAPMKKGIVPSNADDEVKQRFKADLINAGADGAIIVPAGKDGEGKSFDVEMLEAKSRGYTTFDDFKKQIDVDIAICVNGQNLTTEAKGGGLGGGRAADVMEGIRSDYKAQDAKVAKCLRLQVLTYWTKANYGDAELAPRPEYGATQENDAKDEAQSMLLLGQALGAMVAAGVPIDIRAVIDRAGYPMLSEEEVQELEDKQKEQRAEEFAQNQKAAGVNPGGGGGGQSGAGGGGSPGAAAKKNSAKLSASDGEPLLRKDFAGFPICIENPAGSIRLWTDEDGKRIGATTMLTDYGYLEGHIGADGEELDVYLGPDASAQEVYVVHQLRAPDFKAHDEDKFFLGFASADAAKASYLAHRNDERAYGSMSAMSLDDLRTKLKRRTGTGKVRASAGAGGSVALRSNGRTIKGAKVAARYADALVLKAAARGREAMRDLLVSINREVKAASDPADFKARMVKLAKGKQGEELQAVVVRARLMANLAGRADIVEGL